MAALLPGLQRIQVLQIPPESTSIFPSMSQDMAVTMTSILSKILGKLSKSGIVSQLIIQMGYFDSAKMQNASSF